MSPSPTASSSSSSSLCGNEIPIIWYSGSDETRRPTDDLVHAILAGDITRARHLSLLGFSVPATDSWVVYQACLQGIKMMHALSMSPNSKLNRVMPWQMGDRNLHFLLRTPSSRFAGHKALAITYLIQHGAHLLEKDRLGNTAFHILAEVSTQDDTDGVGLVRALLDRDEKLISDDMREACISNINSRNTPLEPGEGSTALMTAVAHDHVECARVLLEHGASPHHIGPLYQPPLYHAVFRDFPAVAKALLEYGAVVTAEIEGEVRSMEMTKVLRDYGENHGDSSSSQVSDE
ncbi:hypothetical protein NW762_012844 [Fusarium torreyae]|uniref:Ankyrin n=1 Tax=Fusarium torreyae TaxID=1237075 RepID=A0A9W8RQ80_9HYPO|nr:hypothetical protein NW762_012844 [Fusarium torreyae]